MVTVDPTLAFMAGIYRLPREGGASSPRFKAYHAHVARVHGLAAYNPMAGPHALEAVDRLLALDAKTIAARAASETTERFAYAGPVTLAVVLCAPGAPLGRAAIA